MAWVSPLERAPLEDLLRRHRQEVAHLGAALGDELAAAGGPAYADEVWLLRYVLSFPGNAVVGAARRALQWRLENAPFVEAARRRVPPSEFSDRELAAIELFFVALYRGTSTFGDPLFFSRLSAYNLKELMDTLGEEKMEQWLGYVNECAWLYCEAATRKRGYFVKQITIQDVSGGSVSQEVRFLRALGRSSKTNEWLRPQLVGKTYVFNPSTFMKWAHKVATGFMSQKSMEKLVAHPVHVEPSSMGPLQLCPFSVALLGGSEALPKCLGGSWESEEILPSAPRPASLVARVTGPRAAGRQPSGLSELPCLPWPLEGPAEASTGAAVPPATGERHPTLPGLGLEGPRVVPLSAIPCGAVEARPPAQSYEASFFTAQESEPTTPLHDGGPQGEAAVDASPARTPCYLVLARFCWCLRILRSRPASPDSAHFSSSNRGAAPSQSEAFRITLLPPALEEDSRASPRHPPCCSRICGRRCDGERDDASLRA